MPFSTPHVLLTVEGSLVSGALNDIWRASFKLPVTVGSIPTEANLLAFLESCASPIQSFHASNTINAGASAKLVSLAAAVIGTDGKYLGGGTQATVRHTYGAPVAGNGASQAPWSQALALTLRTAKPRGAAAYGRAYWPALATLVNADGLVPAVTAGQIAAAAKTMLDAINTAAAANGFPVSGRVSVCSAVGAGQNLPVIKVGIGRKPDRQERRESNLPEDHQYANLAGAAELLAEARDAGVRM